MPWLAFAAAFLLSLMLVPVVRWASFRMGKVSRPRADRWHSKPTPTLGGIGIFVAFVASLLALAAFNGQWGEVHWGLLAGSVMIFLLGLYDDMKRISPPAKLAGQILAAAVVVSLGYTTNFFTPRIPDSLVAQIPNILLTFAWLVGITNAINLLDNMDGLAGGIALIAALVLSYLFWVAGNQSLLIISLALAGSLLGFLVFNFPPASIFMGDSGSLFLGFTLAVLAIARQPRASNVFVVMGVPTLLFLLPILDTALVTFTRLLRGQSPAQGGRDHTSHRLIAFGLNERQAVLALYGVALLAGVAGILIEALQYWLSLVLAPILVLTLALLMAYLGGLKVVTVPASPPEKGLARVLLELTYKRHLLEVVLDFFLIAIAYYLAFLTRFGFTMSAAGLELFLDTLPAAFGGAYLAFFVFGVYRGVWRYVGVNDLMRYLLAAVGSVVLSAAAIMFFYTPEQYSPTLFLLFAVFLFFLLAASRSSFKFLDQVSGRQVRPEEERVLICGAGDNGEMALRWILMNPHLVYRPVGFLDNDPFLMGRHIHGVEVLGGLDQLEAILKSKQINGVIFTSENLWNGDEGEQTLDVCRRNGCWVRTLRLEFQLIE